MKCQKTGCCAPAMHTIKIMVPATGYALESHEPLGMTMDLPLCRPHLGEMDVKQIIGDNSPLRAIFEQMARGRVAPDFARAFIHPLPLESEEYQLFASIPKDTIGVPQGRA